MIIFFRSPPVGVAVVVVVVATAVVVVVAATVVVCVQLLVAQFKRMCREQQWPVVQFIYWPLLGRYFCCQNRSHLWPGKIVNFSCLWLPVQ